MSESEKIKILQGDNAKIHEAEEKLIYQKRELYRNKAFRFSLQLVFIIGLPALLAVFLGKKLDSNYHTGYLYTIICLIVALVISWIMIIFKYRQLNKEIKITEEEIKKIKNKK